MAIEMNTINESHLGQQLFCAGYIVAHVPSGLVRVKLVQGLHGVPKFPLHFGEEAHAINCELEIT